jgi:hypothetical protein
MLHTLAANNYIHTDYKITNIGWEDNEIMNVILIDYDYDTLLKLDENDTYNFVKENGLIRLSQFSTTYHAPYLSNYYDASTRQYTYDEDKIKTDRINTYTKYSIGGLINIIETLDIKYNFNELQKNDPPYFIFMIHPYYGDDRSITTIYASDIVSSLKLSSKFYDEIPTYEQLYKFFLELGREGHIKDVKV